MTINKINIFLYNNNTDLLFAMHNETAGHYLQSAASNSVRTGQ